MSGLRVGPSRRWVRLAVIALFIAVLPSSAAPPTVRSASATPVLDVSAGYAHTCAIRADDGTLRCWGSPEAEDESYASGWNAIDAPEGTFTSVSSGYGFSCAIRTDGTLACWGANSYFQSTPPEGTFLAVDAGWAHACGLRTDGTLECWGANGSGRATPPSGTYTAVSAGWEHSCAIRMDGTIVCWGANDNHESTPPGGTFVAVSAGTYSHTCALRTDGTIACWGYNASHKAEPPQGTFLAVSAGEEHTCAIRSDGTLVCWGDNGLGQLQVPGGTYESVSAGGYHSCAVRPDHTIRCWGCDWDGQANPAPTASMGSLARWTLATQVSLTWGARNGLADVATYDVRYRRAKWNAGFGSGSTTLTGTTQVGATIALSRGYTYCFSARARDADDLVSDWTPEQCSSRPLDDRALARTGKWVAGTGTSDYAGTFVRSTARGAKLTRTGIRANRIALVATTCPTCGTVNVYLGSKLLKAISLYSPTVVHQKVINVKARWSLMTGTLTIKVASSGKKVIIDGLAIQRYP
jgi:hypothetical protein